MKIILNSMVRNESAHVKSAMAHFAELFDEINIVDHCSTDNTVKEIAKWKSSKCKINLFNFKNQGYYQSELMTHFAREQIKSSEMDWVFFLDFDEYLPVKSRNELEQILIQHAEDSVIQMQWHNLIPIKYGRRKHLGGTYYTGPDVSPFCKIAFQPKRLLPLSDVAIEQGNHAITYGPDKTRIAATPSIGLFHIPVDSLNQLEAKIETGTEAYRKHDKGHETALGNHWVKMQKIMKTNANSEHLLNGFIAYYGESRKIEAALEANTLTLSHTDLIANKYRKLKLAVAGSNLKAYSDRPDAKILKNIREITYNVGGEVEIITQSAKAKTKSRQSFVPKNGVKLSALPVHNTLLTGPASFDTLDAFMDKSYFRIETMTPTAWGGHIPFMFSLISHLRPRRYVELGTHSGASFFAACQMFKQLDLPSLAVAVDLWEGDPQAGYYGEDIYNDFEYLRTARYKDQSRSIRSLFIDAADQFENHSVDLIHIDGLHTYEAVKEDYETWRPKLTKNGVMIFHDTNEYQSTFGVWDFFSKIRKDATESFEFKHTHGLGILAFGDAKSNPIIPILKQMNDNPARVEHHYARLGELSVKEALYTLRVENVKTETVPDNAPREIDAVGLGTKTMAKILVRRVKSKVRSMIRARIGI